MTDKYIILENLNDLVNAYEMIEEYNIVISKKDLNKRKIQIVNKLGESLTKMPVYLRDERLVKDLYIGDAEKVNNSFIQEDSSIDEYIWKPRKLLLKKLEIINNDKKLIDDFLNNSSYRTNIYENNTNLFDKYQEYVKIQNNLKDFFRVKENLIDDVKKYSTGEILVIENVKDKKLYLSLDNKYLTTIDFNKSGFNNINIIEDESKETIVNVYEKKIDRNTMINLLKSITESKNEDDEIIINNKTIIECLYDNNLIDQHYGNIDNILENLSNLGWIKSYENANLFNSVLESFDINIINLNEFILNFKFKHTDGLVKIEILE